MMYKVDEETCELVESADGRLTLKSAALLAYHLAVEKMNHWASVRNRAWEAYEREAAKAQEGIGV